MTPESTVLLASEEDAIKHAYASYGEDHSVYGADASASHDGRAKHVQFIVDRFFPVNPDANIIEVGCGDGQLVAAALRAGYLNTAGVDGSPSMISIARQKAESIGSGLAERIHLADAVEYLLNQAQDSVDMVVAIDVIEHLRLHEILNFFVAAQAALRPGGQVLIHVPNGASPFHGRILHGDVTHHRAFTDKSLHQIASLSGFGSVKVYEDTPIRAGLKSTVRSFLWRLVRLTAVASLAIETGQVRGHVLTINLFSVMTK